MQCASFATKCKHPEHHKTRLMDKVDDAITLIGIIKPLPLDSLQPKTK
jgi:hypothetical protein